MAVNAYLRSTTDRVVVPVGKALVTVGFSADVLTTIGLIGVAGGVAVVLLGHTVLGAVILGVATALDALDGTVARLTDTDSPFGAFYDSVADRIADAMIFGACAWIVRPDPRHFAVVIVALSAALITSYIRAKAESLGYDATVGLIERPERIVIIVLSIAFGVIEVGAWILAVGGLLTVVQRLRAVQRQAH